MECARTEDVRSSRKASRRWECSDVLPAGVGVDPSLDVSQYAHTAWKVRDGFSKGVIPPTRLPRRQTVISGWARNSACFASMAFGVSPGSRQQVSASRPDSIRSLLAARDGRFGLARLKGLASWKDGKLTHYPELAGQVRPLLEDREGTVWAGGFAGSTGRLCAIQRGGTQCYGEGRRFGREVGSLYEDSRGNVWAVAVTGLWRWKPGPPNILSDA